MIKRLLDVLISLVGLTIISPIFLLFILLIFLYDFKSPFYVAPRVGKNAKLFKMIKLRSMKINADKSGVASTANDDDRITPIGKLIRKLKFDEISQLINVFFGSMSLVGPRPQVEKDVKLYTKKEKTLLIVKPGITDFSSIVFSDEGNILKGSDDPDRDYNILIRPWKSRLGLFYIKHQNILIDIMLIFFTIISFFNKKWVLKKISNYLCKKNASENIVKVVLRVSPLRPELPPE
jgi:lipopolysaccharide/colanic/teichoic acid biosynthesis glycosyltransferase